MRVVVLAVIALMLSWVPAGAWRKPAQVQILSITAHRRDGVITLDGRIRNTAEKPIEGLVLVFDFIAAGEGVVTSQKSNIDQDVLDPGKESTFHFELDDPVRAVRYQIGAVDAGERDLRVGNAGPFAID